MFLFQVMGKTRRVISNTNRQTISATLWFKSRSSEGHYRCAVVSVISPALLQFETGNMLTLLLCGMWHGGSTSQDKLFHKEVYSYYLLEIIKTYLISQSELFGFVC